MCFRLNCCITTIHCNKTVTAIFFCCFRPPLLRRFFLFSSGRAPLRGAGLSAAILGLPLPSLPAKLPLCPAPPFRRPLISASIPRAPEKPLNFFHFFPKTPCPPPPRFPSQTGPFHSHKRGVSKSLFKIGNKNCSVRCPIRGKRPCPKSAAPDAVRCLIRAQRCGRRVADSEEDSSERRYGNSRPCRLPKAPPVPFPRYRAARPKLPFP